MLRPTPRTRALREVLAYCGYTDAALVAKLGSIALPHPRIRNLPRLLYLTSGATPLDALARLFLLGVPVDTAAVPFPIDELREMGLVESHGDRVQATVALCPYGALVLAMDHPARLALGEARNLVMGISATSTNLDRFTVRKPVRHALDLGTGAGLQALLAARHSTHVSAVDQCPRAVEFARFNIALNDAVNVQVEEGDMFEAVAGRRFDLIVGNLPFVVAPGRSFFYRDSGAPLDSFAARTVAQAAQRLEENGYAHILCDWVQIAAQDWRERLKSWLSDTGCDAWVLRIATYQPLNYAENWIRDSEPETPGHAERVFQEWASYYAQADVQAIMTGFITLRRASNRSNWIDFDDGPDPIPDNAGESVLRTFALAGYERAATDDQLLATPFRLAPDVRLLAQSECLDDGWHAVTSRVQQTAGWRFSGNVDANTSALLALCDGQRTFHTVIQNLAARLEIEPGRLTPSCLPLARNLLRRGFLLPPDQYFPVSTS